MARFTNSNQHAAAQMSQIRHRRQPHAPGFVSSPLDCRIFNSSHDRTPVG